MATIDLEITIDADASTIWSTLRDPLAVTTAFRGPITAVSGDATLRTLIFEGGLSLDERIITIDEGRRRIVYAVLGDLFEHHNAAMEVTPIAAGRCRFRWTSDFLPADAEAIARPIIEDCMAAIGRNLGTAVLPA